MTENNQDQSAEADGEGIKSPADRYVWNRGDNPLLLQQWALEESLRADRERFEAWQHGSTVGDMADMMETAWGIICNAYGGDWSQAPDEWLGATYLLRARWHRYLSSRSVIDGGELGQTPNE